MFEAAWAGDGLTALLGLVINSRTPVTGLISMLIRASRDRMLSSSVAERTCCSTRRGVRAVPPPRQPYRERSASTPARRKPYQEGGKREG